MHLRLLQERHRSSTRIVPRLIIEQSQNRRHAGLESLDVLFAGFDFWLCVVIEQNECILRSSRVQIVSLTTRGDGATILRSWSAGICEYY